MDPADFGRLFLEVTEPLGDSASERAEALGISRQTYHERVKGRHLPSPSTRFLLVVCAAAVRSLEPAARQALVRGALDSL